jgi:hypothetical protein
VRDKVEYQIEETWEVFRILSIIALIAFICTKNNYRLEPYFREKLTEKIIIINPSVHCSTLFILQVPTDIMHLRLRMRETSRSPCKIVHRI